MDKAVILLPVNVFILASIIGTILYLVKKKGMKVDRKGKVFLIIYLIGRTINLIGWITDLAITYDSF